MDFFRYKTDFVLLHVTACYFVLNLNCFEPRVSVDQSIVIR